MSTPTLLFDGDCGFCKYWVAYWRLLTGTAVRYAPYQEALAAFPGLTAAQCRAAIWLVLPDGSRHSGADAAFRVLAIAGSPGLAWSYRYIPLFAALSEAVYRLVAAHRGPAMTLARALWGGARVPARYDRAAWYYVRGIALVYLMAFLSLLPQIRALAGSDGILPLAPYLEAARAGLGRKAYVRLPTLFWLSADDAVLVGACAAGALAALIALAGRCVTPALAGAFALYLSLVYAGQTFMSFQWDLLLLEAGFLACLMGTRQPLVPWLVRLLAFKFMFLSGAVKLLSGDPNWANLGALDYHFETQPLPTPLAWYVHHLPTVAHRAGVIATFAIELVLPFLLFAPRRPRLVAAWGIIVLEAAIALTGNYNFFNVLTVLLCGCAFEDRDLPRWPRRVPALAAPPPRTRLAFAAVCAPLVLANACHVATPFGVGMPAALDRLMAALAPFCISNAYGVFAVMTTERLEIRVEGSDDGRRWLAYEFRYKPGDPARRPTLVAPHQPRLDWQMWFAALGSPDQNPWFGNFLVRLLEGAPDVRALLAGDPFAGHVPRFVRAGLDRYRFTTPAQRAQDGAWWTREPVGSYFPAISLQAAGRAGVQPAAGEAP
ncbi:MAG: lipase maturation factor family protein [Gammaproteobacteria bacterium]|nr:lipase maturation factor family protein [Gammaproteobacteria bacterium]